MPCVSRTYISDKDVADVRRLEKGDKRGAVAELEDLCLRSRCIRAGLLVYFDEMGSSCSTERGDLFCDRCIGRDENEEQDRLERNKRWQLKREETSDAVVEIQPRKKRNGFVCPRRKTEK